MRAWRGGWYWSARRPDTSPTPSSDCSDRWAAAWAPCAPFLPAGWSIGRAVAASSCFPPAFAPMKIDLKPDRFKGGQLKFAAAVYGIEFHTDIPEADPGVNALHEPRVLAHAAFHTHLFH